jgi:hypothetical protein
MGKWTDAAVQQRTVYDTAASYLTDEQALTVKGMYWQWDDLVKAGVKVKKGYRFQYGTDLWRTEQPEYTFVSTYVPGSQGTESLFSKVDEAHKGTFEDPIPYEKNMEIYEGLYYIQYDVKYLCIRSSGQPLYHDLNTLAGNYVEVALEGKA